MNPGRPLYSRRDIAVMAYCFGLLTGLIVGLASCEPTEATVVEVR